MNPPGSLKVAGWTMGHEKALACSNWMFFLFFSIVFHCFFKDDSFFGYLEDISKIIEMFVSMFFHTPQFEAVELSMAENYISIVKLAIAHAFQFHSVPCFHRGICLTYTEESGVQI